MSGRMSRNKGKGGELEFANKLGWMMNDPNVRRGRQFCGGQDSPDVRNDDCLPKVHVEVKRAESLSLYKALAQAEEDAGEGKIPVVAHRRNNRPWVLIIRMDDLPALAEQVYLTLARNK